MRVRKRRELGTCETDVSLSNVVQGSREEMKANLTWRHVDDKNRIKLAKSPVGSARGFVPVDWGNRSCSNVNLRVTGSTIDGR